MGLSILCCLLVLSSLSESSVGLFCFAPGQESLLLTNTSRSFHDCAFSPRILPRFASGGSQALHPPTAPSSFDLSNETRAPASNKTTAARKPAAVYFCSKSGFIFPSPSRDFERATDQQERPGRALAVTEVEHSSTWELLTLREIPSSSSPLPTIPIPIPIRFHRSQVVLFHR